MLLFFRLKKRLKPLAFAVVILSSFLSFSQDTDYSLLWKITGKKLTQPSYLFATMHVDDARAFRFSDAVLPAIENCETFALEVHPDSMMIGFLKESKRASQDPKALFKELLNDEEYQLLVERFIEVNGHSFEDSGLKNASTIIDLLYKDKDEQGDKSTFVDLYLLGQARTMRKTLVGLEPIENQLFHFEKLNKMDKRLYIMEQLDQTIDTLDAQVESLKEIYARGNMAEIEREVAFHGGFDETMSKRNHDMVESIVKLLEQTTLFSAVGAAHLPGEEGLINLIRSYGYTVEPVEAKFTGVAETYVIDESKMEWFTYVNDTLGYSLELPSPPVSEEKFEDFTIYSSVNLNDGANYLFLGANLGKNHWDMASDENMRLFAETMAKNYKGQVEHMDVRPAKNDIKTVLARLKLEDSSYMRTALYIKDRMMYYLAVQADSASIDKPSVERFINSIKITEPIIIEPIKKSWQVFSSEEGAFSVTLPEGWNDLSRPIEYPLADGSTAQMYLNMFMSTDLTENKNYLIRYNNMPDGYYLEDFETGFEGALSDLTKRATLRSDPKPIELQGHPGYEYHLKLQDTLPSICRVYFRGNRTYLLFYQELSESSEISADNPFFNSFKFEEYNSSTLNTVSDPEKSFELLLFEEVKHEIDSVEFDASYLKNSHVLNSTDPNSGDAYVFSYSDLQDYFRISNIDDYFDEFIEGVKGWQDSVISKSPITKGNAKGIEFQLLSPTNPHPSRHQMWFDGQRIFTMENYSTKENAFGRTADYIFNSYKSLSKKMPFDLYSSKARLMMANLKSKDTVTFNRAVGAFSYYEFEETDVPYLHEAIAKKFGNKRTNELVKIKLAEELSRVNSPKSVDILEEVYKKADSDSLKATILTSLSAIKQPKALDVYTQLLFEKPPKSIDGFEWSIMEVFKDSAELTLQNFEKLLKLNTMDYRTQVLHAATNLLDSLPDSRDQVNRHFNKLFEHAVEDLETFIKVQRDTTDFDYSTHQAMYAYFQLIKSLKSNHHLVDAFTQKILDSEIDLWYEEDAVEVRILSGLELKESIIKTYTDSLSSRYRTLKALHSVKNHDAIDPTYLTSENWSVLSLYQYLADEDYPADDIAVLGSLEHEGQTYFALKFSYSYEDSEIENYVAVTGPIDESVILSKLELLPIYTDWDYLGDDWKEQATALLPDVDKTSKD